MKESHGKFFSFFVLILLSLLSAFIIFSPIFFGLGGPGFAGIIAIYINIILFPIIYAINYFVFQLLVNKLSLYRPNKFFVFLLSFLIIASLSLPPWPIVSFSSNQINSLKSRNFQVRTEILHEEILKNSNYPTFVTYKYEVAIHNQSRSTFPSVPIVTTLVLTDTSTGKIVQHFFSTSNRNIQNINPGDNLISGEFSLKENFRAEVGTNTQIQLSVVFDQYPYNSPFEGAYSKSYLNQTKLDLVN